MGLRGDRAVAHRSRREAFDDFAGGLNLVQRNRRPHTRTELEQAAQRCHPLALVVDETGVLLEDLVLPGAGGVLQLEDRLGVEEVILALPAPLVVPTHLEFAMRAFVRPVQVGQPVAGGHVGGDVVQGDPAGWAAEPGEVLVEHVLRDADRLEQLRTGVGSQRGNAHLGHHLQDALAGSLDVVVQRRLAVDTLGDALERTSVEHVLDRLEHQVRVDRCRAATDQHRHVVHLAGITGFDHQTHMGARPVPHQMVVHRRNGEQRRYRGHLLVGSAVGQDDHPRPVGNGRRRLGAHLVQCCRESGAPLGDGVQTANHLGPHAVWAPVDLIIGVEIDQLGQLVVTQNRL